MPIVTKTRALAALHFRDLCLLEISNDPRKVFDHGHERLSGKDAVTRLNGFGTDVPVAWRFYHRVGKLKFGFMQGSARDVFSRFGQSECSGGCVLCGAGSIDVGYGKNAALNQFGGAREVGLGFAGIRLSQGDLCISLQERSARATQSGLFIAIVHLYQNLACFDRLVVENQDL